jgi:BirA family biotin operon repressor/biotin-[acetyl-CoA-carboxylase] ligase
MDIESLRERLTAMTPGFTLRWHEEVDSTNTLAMRLAGNGAAERTIVLADHQTAGRGRMQRIWQSPPGCNLYFSVILRPLIAPFRAAQITFLAGVAIFDALSPFCPEGVEIKWPNDLLINGRKICGILSEMRMDEGRAAVVLGVGINVNIEKGDFAPEYQNIAASLLSVTGVRQSRADVLCSFCTHFSRWYRVFGEEGFEPLRKGWLARTKMVGQNVRILFDSEVKEGVVAGIDDDGALLLVLPGGATERIIAGDATIVKG